MYHVKVRPSYQEHQKTFVRCGEGPLISDGNSSNKHLEPLCCQNKVKDCRDRVQISTLADHQVSILVLEDAEFSWADNEKSLQIEAEDLPIYLNIFICNSNVLPVVISLC